MCVLTDMGVYPIWRSLMHGEAIEREGAIFSVRFGLLMHMVRARGHKIHVVLHENDRPILFLYVPCRHNHKGCSSGKSCSKT